MKAIEKNDSSNMSAQGQAPINLHKWGGSDGEIQSEDVQEESERASLWTDSVPTTLHVSLSCMCAASEHSPRTQTPSFKAKAQTISHNRA